LETKVSEENRNKTKNKFEELLETVNIDQIFLVFKARTQINEKIIPYYDYLMSKEITGKHLTIVRAEFPEFEEEEKVNQDIESLKSETKKLKEIFDSVPTVHVDNPPLVGRSAEANKEIREISRQKLFEYLATQEERSGSTSPESRDDETHDLPADSTSTDEEDLTSLINEAKNLKEKGSLYTSQLLSEKINAIEEHPGCLTANDTVRQEIENLKKELIELIKEESLTKLFDEPEERQI